MTILTIATVIGWIVTCLSLVGVVRGPGVVRRMRRLLGVAIWASLSILLSALLLVLHAFHVFSDETFVARVTTQRQSPEEFELTYAPAEGSSMTVRLRGDQWSISGGIVKWHPWLTALGLKSYYKPMRLSGQFSNLEQQRAHLPTVYPLDPVVDRVWEGLYWADPYLPFIEAVYGSAAYVYVEPGITQDIAVTPSGYIIKREKRAK